MLHEKCPIGLKLDCGASTIQPYIHTNVQATCMTTSKVTSPTFEL